MVDALKKKTFVEMLGTRAASAPKDVMLAPAEAVGEAVRASFVPRATHAFSRYINGIRAQLAAQQLPTSAEGVHVFVVGELGHAGDSRLDEHAEEVVQTLSGTMGLARGASVDVLLPPFIDSDASRKLKAGNVTYDELGEVGTDIRVHEMTLRQLDLREVVKRAPRDRISFVNMSNGLPPVVVARNIVADVLNAPKDSPLFRSMTRELGHPPGEADKIAIEMRVLHKMRESAGAERGLKLQVSRSLLAEEVAAARKQGVMVFKSAGNERKTVVTPDDAKANELGSGMVLVGAIDLGKSVFDSSDDTVTEFSVEGAKLGAVGAKMPFRGGERKGTSYATPFMVSVAMLMAKANPRITPDQVEQILSETSTPVKGGGLNTIHPVTAIARAKALSGSSSTR